MERNILLGFVFSFNVNSVYVFRKNRILEWWKFIRVMSAFTMHILPTSKEGQISKTLSTTYLVGPPECQKIWWG